MRVIIAEHQNFSKDYSFVCNEDRFVVIFRTRHPFYIKVRGYYAVNLQGEGFYRHGRALNTDKQKITDRIALFYNPAFYTDVNRSPR